MMRNRAFSGLFAALILTAVWSKPGQAQDTTPPTVTSATATIELTRNGDPLAVTVDAAANEPSRFEVTCTYVSSYLPFVDPPTPYWYYKTQAVGDHVETSQPPTPSVTGLEVVVGPRVYHSDRLTVTLVAIDAAGNRSQPTVLHDEPIEMPFAAPPPIPAGDTYGVTTHWNGSYRPSDHGKADIDDWAKPEVILCTPGFLYEGPQTEPGWDHWVERLRAEPGSRNQAVVGFTGVSALDSNSYPVQKRLHAFMRSVHDEVDENVLVHLVDGSLPWSVDNNPNRILIDIAHPTARDTFAWFLTQEWNHCENREPRVGLMFDVYEYWNEYRVNGEFSMNLIDRDRDGIPYIDDDDEILATREGRIAFFRSLRRHITESAIDPNVGRYFLIGANTVAGRSDAEMLAEMDFIMLEDIQCATGSGHEFLFFDGNDCHGDGVGYFPFHGAAAENYVRHFCTTGLFNNVLFHDAILPNPADLSQAWEDLPSAMRSDAGGPFLAPEAQGSVGGDPDHPGYLEAFGLLFDHVYPIWHRMESEENWPRQYWHPSEEGLDDLHDLGPAISPLIRESLPDDLVYWRRQYAAGSVEIIIADTTVFDCAAGDLFDYRVTVQGETRRLSPGWGAPELDTFFIGDWDTLSADRTVRVDLTAFASEPLRWERSYRVGDSGPWSEPVATAGRTPELAGFWDTGVAPTTGPLWVRVRGIDMTGRDTDWAKREVALHRLGGYGVTIADTTVLGTAYGRELPGGGHEILGRGTSAPEFAPPHFLEIRGSVPAGFTPVEVHWRNSLGGEGVVAGAVSWQIPGVPLHRGTNVITITCVDAAGTALVGEVTKEWNFPGKPGRQD